jgi:curved DNA-binding protein CbpA
MVNPEEMEWARKTLGLGNNVRLTELKAAYRTLAKKYHPDKKGDAEKMATISKANKIIMEYIENYNYSLKPDDVISQDPEYRLMQMYRNDSTWGTGTSEKIRRRK